MENMVTVFQYLLMDYIKSRDITKKLDFKTPENTNVDLTATSSFKTEYPIAPDKPPPSDVAQIKTAIP